jgi:putative ABC transport system ATP-binding protein
LLVADTLHKIYNKTIENHVIKGISLSIEKGEFVVISGKSGSGKSTLLYLLSGLEVPTSGRVIFNDISIGELRDSEICRLRREKFGFVFQFYNLVQNLNVLDNILLPLDYDGKSSNEKRERVYEYIEIMGIGDKLKSYPYQLSGGQQQRVAIARALAIDPEIIFADEPTGNLDSATGKEVLGILNRLNRELKKTIILVTHDPSISKEQEAREIHLEDGMIINP